jgi:hypothetical protein
MTIKNKRPIIRYNNVALLRSKSPAFSELSNSGENIKFLPRVESLDFSFDTNKNTLETIGSKNLQNHFYNPGVDVNLNINLIENFDGIFLEYFNGDGLVENVDKDINIYAIISETLEGNAINDSLDSFDMVSFGNCQLDSFSMSQSVNGLINSAYSFVAVNVLAERISGISGVFSGDLPALNLTGNQTNEISNTPAKFSFSGLNEKLTGSSVIGEIFPSYKTNITISGLNFLIETDSVQSFDFNANIEKKDIYTIGKKYPIKRKSVFPMEGNFSISNKVSSFTLNQDSVNGEKDLREYLKDNRFYNITITSEDFNGATVEMQMPSGRLSSQSYSSSIGSDLECNLDFSFDLFGMNNSVNSILTKPTSGYLQTKSEQNISRKV